MSSLLARITRRATFTLIVTCFALGAAVTLAVLVAWPGFYLEIADRFRWRLGLPAVWRVQVEATLVREQLRGDAVAGDNAILLFGDSHLHGLPASSLADAVTNYAIGGEPASRLAKRIGRYTSVRKARRVVLLSGSNDLAAGSSPAAAADSVAAAMRQVPIETTVLLMELPPSRGDAARQAAGRALNVELAARCSARQSCRFLPLSALADPQGRLRADYASDDGIHLSAAGYQVLANTLIEALRQTSMTPADAHLQ